MGQVAAAYTGAHDQRIDGQRMGLRFGAFTRTQLDTMWRAAINTQYFRILQELYAALGAGISQTTRVFMNIARGVRRRKETAVVCALQSGFNLVDFIVGNGAPLQATLVQ
ncbi:hypothetical protein GCM10010096_26140 [Alcaligenes pakistanensis]|uniref:Uncharacterized protein n=1 Tax=Alcaligenes pakistanensis TaxID=1482717 RepID=A0A8H9IMW1_9BURK|nr:hypothetical protein GCM10010096_26140 [Alcaligenes pakistanensis]